jgi:hypothetical protein
MAWESMEPFDRLTVIQEQAHKIKGECKYLWKRLHPGRPGPGK